MDIRKEAAGLREQIKQLSLRIARDQQNQLRAEGALQAFELLIAEEDAMPKLQASDIMDVG